MNIWIICSKSFYSEIEEIKNVLESFGHKVTLPNSYYHPEKETEAWNKSPEEHVKFKQEMFRLSRKIAENVDAALVLNYEKHGTPNYIGGATFLEIYEAFCNNKKIYFMNDIPQGILFDEIQGINPTVIHGNLTLIK